MSTGKVADALKVIQAEINSTADPLEMASALVIVGEFVLERLGVWPAGEAAVSIDIGEHDAGQMSIRISWPIEG